MNLIKRSLAVGTFFALILLWQLYEIRELLSKQFRNDSSPTQAAFSYAEAIPAKTPSSSSLQSEFCRLSSVLRNVLDKSETYTVYSETRIGSTFDIVLYKKNDIVSQTVLNGNGWDMDKIDTIDRALNALKKRDNKKYKFLDIGANIGYLTNGVASLGHPVYAFEPLPDNEVILRTTLCLNPTFDITYFNVGLGEKEMNCVIYSGNINHGDGTVSCDPNFKLPKDYTLRGKMDVKVLDTFVDKLRDVGVIKIDVEGFEGSVINGGHKVFTQASFIIMEFQPNWIRNNGQDPTKILKFFVDQGYTLHSKGFQTESLTADKAVETFSQGELADIYIAKKNAPSLTN